MKSLVQNHFTTAATISPPENIADYILTGIRACKIRDKQQFRYTAKTTRQHEVSYLYDFCHLKNLSGVLHSVPK